MYIEITRTGLPPGGIIVAAANVPERLRAKAPFAAPLRGLLSTHSTWTRSDKPATTVRHGLEGQLVCHGSGPFQACGYSWGGFLASCNRATSASEFNNKLFHALVRQVPPMFQLANLIISSPPHLGEQSCDLAREPALWVPRSEPGWFPGCVGGGAGRVDGRRRGYTTERVP